MIHPYSKSLRRVWTSLWYHLIGIWSGIGMIRNTNSRIKINNTTTQKESTPKLNVENPKIGKNHGNLRFQNKFTNFWVYKAYIASRVYSRDMHLYFKATALDTMFTLPNKINNQKKNPKETQTSKPVTSKRKSCCGPNNTSLDLRLYTCNEFSFSITLFSSSHTCSLVHFWFLVSSYTPLFVESLFSAS